MDESPSFLYRRNSPSIDVMMSRMVTRDFCPVPNHILLQSMVPTLIYDGHCGFCKIWVNYWRRLTGDRVLYSSSQSAAGQYPQISADEFKRSVWLVYLAGSPF